MGNYVGLVSLSDHSTKLTSVRNMLLDGHIFVVVVFKGKTVLLHCTGSCLLIWKKRKRVALRSSETRSGGGCSFLKLGKQNQYTITDNVVVGAAKTLLLR